MPAAEGVIQFQLKHETAPLADVRFGAAANELLAWRRWLWQLGGIGQSPKLYGGVGFGNVSARVGAPSAPKGQRAFLITGTQTAQFAQLQLNECALVTHYEAERNFVSSTGLARPSSESLTHGALYDLSPALRWVFHVHIPHIWRAARPLRLPTSDPSAGYGTPEMALQMRRLWQSTELPEIGAMAMGGHEDGIITFGRSPQEAAHALTKVWVKSVALGYSPATA